jgi:hypothetical protein
MSNLNAGIILGGRQPDVINSFAQGQRARAVSDEMQSRNALRNVYQTQGAGILAGDQNALNALAQHDPQQALAIQGQHQVQSQRDQTMQMRIAEYARSVGKEQAAAQAAQLEQGITRAIGAYQAGDLNAVNQILQSAGEQPLESLEQFPAIAALYGDALETLKSVTEFGADPDPEYTTINGQLVQSNAAGGPVAVQVEGLRPKEKTPLSAPGKVQADINSGFLPEGTPLGSPSSVINNNVDTGGGSKLFETLDKKQGEMFSSLIDQGMQAPTKIAMVDEVERILADQNTPEGFEAAFKYAAGQYGVKTEGLDALQSVQAIINRMVPAQRQPGSGPMSDADLALFKQSLPQLINTREGNLIIARTLRGIAQYEAAQGQIAAAVANRELTPKQARQALAELENPLQIFRENSAAPTSIGGFDAETQALIDKHAGD